MADRRDDPFLRIVVVIALALILVGAVGGIVVTAYRTDRDLRFAESLTFAGFVVLCGTAAYIWRGKR